MGIRVDPCTGMIVSGPRRPVKFPPFKGGPREPIQLTPIAQLTLAQLKEIAQEIGKIIADQLKGVQTLPIQPSRKSYVSREEIEDSLEIDIDESIIDVGIGKQDLLEKGQGSAEIAKPATKQDNLFSAKQALRAMKVK